MRLELTEPLVQVAVVDDDGIGVAKAQQQEPPWHWPISNPAAATGQQVYGLWETRKPAWLYIVLEVCLIAFTLALQFKVFDKVLPPTQAAQCETLQLLGFQLPPYGVVAGAGVLTFLRSLATNGSPDGRGRLPAAPKLLLWWSYVVSPLFAVISTAIAVFGFEEAKGPWGLYTVFNVQLVHSSAHLSNTVIGWITAKQRGQNLKNRRFARVAMRVLQTVGFIAACLMGPSVASVFVFLPVTLAFALCCAIVLTLAFVVKRACFARSFTAHSNMVFQWVSWLAVLSTLPILTSAMSSYTMLIIAGHSWMDTLRIDWANRSYTCFLHSDSSLSTLLTLLMWV